MAFEDVKAELGLLMTRMQNEPQDRHELYLQLMEKLNELQGLRHAASGRIWWRWRRRWKPSSPPIRPPPRSRRNALAREPTFHVCLCTAGTSGMKRKQLQFPDAVFASPSTTSAPRRRR